MGMRQLDVFQFFLPALSGIFIIGVGGFQTAAFSFPLFYPFFYYRILAYSGMQCSFSSALVFVRRYELSGTTTT